MTKARHVVWAKMNLGNNSEEAEDDFDDISQDQGTDMKDSDGEPRARVKRNEEDLIKSGSRESQIEQHRHPQRPRNTPHALDNDDDDVPSTGEMDDTPSRDVRRSARERCATTPLSAKRHGNDCSRTDCLISSARSTLKTGETECVRESF